MKMDHFLENREANYMDFSKALDEVKKILGCVRLASIDIDGTDQLRVLWPNAYSLIAGEYFQFSTFHPVWDPFMWSARSAGWKYNHSAG